MMSYVSFSALLFLSFFALPARAETFEEALAAAYKGNPALMAARAQLRATDEKVAEALSGYRPSLDAFAGTGKSRQSASGYDSKTLTPHDVGIQLTQPIFRGFRTTASVDAAEAEVQAGRAQLEQAEQNLLFDAARAYLDVVSGQKVLELTRKNEEVLRQRLEETQSRFEVGEVTKTDISQSESRLAAATAARVMAEGNLVRDRATYRRVIGHDPMELETPTLKTDIPPRMDDVIGMAETKNPSIVAAHFAQEAAQANVGFATGSLLPELSLVGSVSRGWEQSIMTPDRQDEATIMARVTIPLYRGGADYARERAARETASQKDLELQDVREHMRMLAIQAWQNLQTANAAMKAHASEIEAAELALRGVYEEEKAGTRTTLDALNAEQELLAARVNHVKAEHDKALAFLQIKAVVGALSAKALGLDVEPYNPTRHYEDVRDKWIGLGG